MLVKVAYIVVMYPRVSHTFVQNEVWALRDHGVDVTTFSIRKADAGNILSKRDELDAQNTVNVLPLSPRSFINRHLATIVRHPVAFLRTLKQGIVNAPNGARAKLWSCFYAVEALAVWKEANQRGIRHLHAHFANVACDVALLASSFGNRVGDAGDRWTWSFTMHGPAEFNDVEHFNLRYKANSADAIACISQFCKSTMEELASADAASRMHVVHCGIDLERFPLTDRSPEDTAPRGTVRVLCVGRLVAVKAQNVLIEAVSLLVKEGLDVELLLVGDGPTRRQLEAQVHTLELQDRITFTGNVGQDDIRRIYKDVDIFALPSYSEGLPVVLMEAMASGLPVITTNVAGIPELVRNGESGLIVPPGDVDALCNAIGILASDPSLRAAFGTNGRKVVESEFDVNKTSKHLLVVLSEAAYPRSVPLPAVGN